MLCAKRDVSQEPRLRKHDDSRSLNTATRQQESNTAHFEASLQWAGLSWCGSYVKHVRRDDCGRACAVADTRVHAMQV